MTGKEKTELIAQIKKDRAEDDKAIAYEIAMRKIDPNFVGDFSGNCGFDD